MSTEERGEKEEREGGERGKREGKHTVLSIITGADRCACGSDTVELAGDRASTVSNEDVQCGGNSLACKECNKQKMRRK